MTSHIVSREIMVTACDCKSRNSLKTESFKEIKQCSEKKHLKYNFHMIFPLNDIILYCCGSLFWYVVLYRPFSLWLIKWRHLMGRHLWWSNIRSPLAEWHCLPVFYIQLTAWGGPIVHLGEIIAMAEIKGYFIGFQQRPGEGIHG